MHFSNRSRVFQADKLRNQQELERLQTKFIGTGHPDTSSWEFKTNVHRDTNASVVGHRPLLMYNALALNENIIKTRAHILRVRHIRGVGSVMLMLANIWVFRKWLGPRDRHHRKNDYCI